MKILIIKDCIIRPQTQRVHCSWVKHFVFYLRMSLSFSTTHSVSRSIELDRVGEEITHAAAAVGFLLQNRSTFQNESNNNAKTLEWV